MLSQGNYNMAWLGIEPATARSRVRRANHSATLPPLYADDTQLYKSVPFSDLQLLVQRIETCSGNVKKWMTDNKLKMNNEKTEILLCGPKKYVESSDCDHICIEGENISFYDNARNLGVYFDYAFSMQHHVKQLCESLFF